MKLFAEQALLPGGWQRDVLIDVDATGDIAAVRIATGVEADARFGILVPGIANLHSHAFQRAMAGLSEVAGPGEDRFWSWRELMYRFLERLGPDAVEAIAAQLYIEMLQCGYTGVAEFHYLHHDPDGKPYRDRAEMSMRCIHAAREVGIAITHLPVLYAHSGFGAQPPAAQQRRFLNSVDELLAMIDLLAARFGKDADVRVGAAAHSLRAVSPEQLTALREGLHGPYPQAPLHVHIAEQTREVEECLDWSGARPVQWLFENQEVDAHWCLVHATHVSSGELQSMARAGAVVGLCPTTEANLGDGIFPAVEYQRHLGRFGIGSDSHVSTSPVEELRWLEYGQRLLYRRRNLLAGAPDASTGSVLFDTALAGGAQATGRPTGAIAEGSRADLVALDAEHPVLVGRRGTAIIDAWLFAGNHNPVTDVFVGGRRVIAEGRHEQAGPVAERFRASVRELLT